jgi:hypothetical protein
MRYFGKVFVEFWDGNKWRVSAIWFWQYLLMRLWGYCGSATSNRSDYDFRRVSRKNIIFQKNS